MTDSTDRAGVVDEQSPEPSSGREWHAPTLTELGAAIGLTAGTGQFFPDGPGVKDTNS